MNNKLSHQLLGPVDKKIKEQFRNDSLGIVSGLATACLIALKASPIALVLWLFIIYPNC